jgi:hypothetical protein
LFSNNQTTKSTNILSLRQIDFKMARAFKETVPTPITNIDLVR